MQHDDINSMFTDCTVDCQQESQIRKAKTLSINKLGQVRFTKKRSQTRDSTTEAAFFFFNMFRNNCHNIFFVALNSWHTHSFFCLLLDSFVWLSDSGFPGQWIFYFRGREEEDRTCLCKLWQSQLHQHRPRRWWGGLARRWLSGCQFSSV